MELNALTAIGAIDGRYRSKVAGLAPYFSEYGLIKYRVFVEIQYFIALVEHPLPQLEDFDHQNFSKLLAIYENFSETDARAIKDIEKVTNHDVKAVEYFLKRKFDDLGLQKHKEFIHFGLTSQDINNTAIPYSLKRAIENVYLPQLAKTIEEMKTQASLSKSTPMLAKTHGQPASPTLLGKEWNVFITRLEQQLTVLSEIPFAAKFGGATGNFNAHTVAYPDEDWHAFGNKFVTEKLNLSRSFPTTQIEHYDHLAALMDGLKRINVIFMDFAKDMWQYISMNYYKQKIKKGEVGSSAMPHKVNPIDFENAEGNLGIANALFEHLSSKLPISRLQRDLTDSTVLRNLGNPIAHSLIALLSLQKGIGKLEINEAEIAKDLEQNWAVVAEAIQTILRREEFPNPYEALKELTRTNSEINAKTMESFIATLEIKDSVKAELRKITPSNYTGQA